MQNAIIRRVIILGTVTMIGLAAMQTYWVVSTWNINEQEFHNKVTLALFRTAKSLAAYNGSNLPNRDIVKRQTSNYYIVNIEDHINPDLLEYSIQRELEYVALNVNFEYAIYDCYTDEMEYGGYCEYMPGSSVADKMLGDLPAYEDFTYYFGVKFPTRSGYLLTKMQLSAFISLILLITIAFFAYSMFVILRQRRLSALQKDFINNMTHEFKTPLSTIRIAAEVFRKDEGIQQNERLYRYANIINEQYDRLNRQVEKVLQIASLESSDFALKQELLALPTVVEPLLNTVRMRVEALNGQLEVAYPEQWSTYLIQADRLHLANILYNLMDNAIKYSGPSPDIGLQIVRQDSNLEITIRDRGPGIAREHQRQVFDKFYRVPTGNVHNVKGFGLGLFYVKQICDAHHWQLTLDSEPGQGTTIRIAMPISKHQRTRQVMVHP